MTDYAQVICADCRDPLHGEEYAITQDGDTYCLPCFAVDAIIALMD